MLIKTRHEHRLPSSTVIILQNNSTGFNALCYRATARDVITHRNQYKIHFRMASKTRGTNVRHTRATVIALLEFLYKWMPLHLAYTIAIVVCEETPYKASDRV